MKLMLEMQSGKEGEKLHSHIAVCYIYGLAIHIGIM